ncbi:MAG: 5-(carboxyamino)imidazole ribonucleotide mutase [Spirochaetaceae bacterium]|jgi:5-(carboxyamino)imidazole ribonucleotide mutase|nr:5-(carboxyamino)imidazole ribonucleotide mutase [Spirochaetaceae bacterium]
MKIALVLGSASDMPVAQKAEETLAGFGIDYEIRILSAHRSPDAAASFARDARKAGFGVIIAFAGMAAHLAGTLAAHSTLPVIGVPCKGGLLDGLDALFSTVQMPAGVPVGAVALNGGVNAALLAAEILSLADSRLADELAAYKQRLADETAQKDAQLQGRFDERRI